MVKMAKISSLTSGLMSFAKALPLVTGALGGLVIPAGGGTTSPVKAMLSGDAQSIGDTLAKNYLFYDVGEGKFTTRDGRGVKLLAAGVVIHKLINWIDG
jgi:hypothetical protein